MRALALAVSLSAVGLASQEVPAAAAEAATYWVYVAAESADEIYKVAFDGTKGRVAEVIQVGYQPTEIEGPHGLTVSPDGQHWYVSMAHGKPFGLLYKYTTDGNEFVAETELGMFPATMQISSATGLLYCVNFNLHGRMLPSSVSIVDPEEMVEVARVTTGPMPHGSRCAPDGRFHYSCAMMSGHLYEIDAARFEVARRLELEEGPIEGHESVVKPTWVQPHPKQRRVYVALNGDKAVVEVDLEKWQVARRFETAAGPYNLDITPDGRHMVVTYKTAGAIGVWDLESGKERARIPSTRRVTHGVVISPDSRYAFVTAEGVGAEPGVVDIVDIRTAKKVTSVDVGLQAGGIAFWKKD